MYPTKLKRTRTPTARPEERTFHPTPRPSEPAPGSPRNWPEASRRAFTWNQVDIERIRVDRDAHSGLVGGSSDPPPAAIALVLLPGRGFDDYNKPPGVGGGGWKPTFLRRANIELARFYVASPGSLESKLGFLTGRNPASFPGTSSRPLRSANANIMTLMRQAGYKVAHFGTWPFPDEPLKDYADTYFVSNNARDVVLAARSWLKTVSPSSKIYVNLWLPEVYTNFRDGFGLKFKSAQSYVNRVQGVDLNNVVCQDSHDDPAQGDTYRKRYTTCTRQTYRASRMVDDELITAFLTSFQKAIPKKPSFALVTSESGAESPLVDAGAEPRTRFRGNRGSLYEGGIRVRAYIAASLLGREIRPVQGTISSAIFSALDFFPTVAAIARITLAGEVRLALDGADIRPALRVARGSVKLQRPLPLMWEWRHATLPNPTCLWDSPRWAILSESSTKPGSVIKVLVEPRWLFDEFQTQ